MPKINLLSDVQPVAVSLVKRGANRQRFFLMKSEGTLHEEPLEGTEPLVELPGAGERLIAKSDWSAVYCVVAAPGERELPGLHAEPGDPDDEWASEAEIVKAAHAFAKSGGLINRMHEDLEPYGTLVENAVALADIDVDGTTIKKGSWYIAIEPNAEGRKAIEAGEFTGVSVQGTGLRKTVEVEKAAPSAQGGKGNRSTDAGSYQTCSGCGSKVKLGAKKCPNCGQALAGDTGKKKVAKAPEPEAGGAFRRTIKKVAEALGVDTAELEAEEEAELAKAVPATFDQRIAQREMEEEIPSAMDALRSSIYDAMYPLVYPGEDQPSAGEIRSSLDKSLEQFHGFMIGVYDRVSGDAADDISKVQMELGDDLATLRVDTDEEDTEAMGDTQNPTRIEKLESDLGELKGSVDELVKGLKPVIDRVQEQAAPTVEDISTKLEEATTTLSELQKGIERLGQGTTRQPEDVTKAADADPLAGILA